MVDPTAKMQGDLRIPDHVDLLGNPNPVVKWLEEQAKEIQQSCAGTIFDTILGEAAQPKSVSGNACVRLCGFVERTSKTQSEELQQWAFSQEVIFKLFDFYIEWNEFDHHRSMRLVLDSIAQLVGRNPDKHASSTTKDALLDNLMSIVVGRSTKPVAKSAMKTLDYLLAKSVFSLDDVKTKRMSYLEDSAGASELEVWRVFMNDLFQWMRLHFVCPAAGKFIVSVYRCLRKKEQESSVGFTVDVWHQWLLDFLTEDATLLERIKNYIFLPLFKVDRSEALLFLQRMNESSPATPSNSHDLDTGALFRLAALETGKKVGLVEEPELGDIDRSLDKNDPIVLHENVVESVLTHPSHEVRSLAFTLLISSPSTTRPYTSTTLNLLTKHLATFFADPDAKFRVDVCARARDMFKRVRGAICVLKRSIPRAMAKAQKNARSGHHVQADQDSAKPLQPILYRANLISLPEAQLRQCLAYHEQFLRWYIGFLCSELIPTASYQRHITSLKILTSILHIEGGQNKAWETTEDQELFFDLLNNKWMRALMDLLMDPFDDVREISSTAIARILSDERYRRFASNCERSPGGTAHDLAEFLKRANNLCLRTARADHSDGVARASQLLYKFLETNEQRLSLCSSLIDALEQKIKEAETDLGRAVLETPLHGDFASLNFVWQVVADMSFSESELEAVGVLQARLVDSSERIWMAVREVLCDDSPEGHLPQELEEQEGLDTKGLLSFSFRAIHESSNLMRTLVSTIKDRSREGSIHPPTQLFERVGKLTFQQLSDLRHRGAFTTVALTFATCCQMTKGLPETEGEPSILDVWYQGTMNAIYSQVSTTRRSAGIPSMMTGILSANASHPSFEQAIEKLIEIAGMEARVTETDGSNLPQVHAYNCLKDIFKNSYLTSLGNKSEKYLPRCLELAAGGLRSEVWAIRNCGLIFLRSLIDCLFGSQESKAMIEAGWDGKANRVPYHRYPNLPKVLANLLKSGHQMVVSATAATTSAAESVFPALDIIRRSGPPDLLRDEIQIYVAAYLSSPVWHVREIAARTLCSCLLHDKWLVFMKEALEKALSDSTDNGLNHIHGVLLTLKFVFERLSEVAVDRLTTDLSELAITLAQTRIDERYINCPDVLAAYLEVVNMVWFQTSISQPLQPTKTSISVTDGSALFRSQSIINRIIYASQEDEPVNLVRTLLLEERIGSDTMVSALEVLPKLWNSTSAADHILIPLCTLYVEVCLKTGFVEAQVVAINNLAELMDTLIHRGNIDKLPTSSLIELWAVLSLRSINPALSNAIIRSSGCVLAAARYSKSLSANSLHNWGLMMVDAGSDDKSFDTRFAVAESLRSFFAAAGGSYAVEDCLPALLALYDILGDDDDEVRDVGSAAVQEILNQNLVPLEAANRLLQWLAENFADSTAFRSHLCSRIVGNFGTAAGDHPWKSANTQLKTALDVDDSLFAIEEQNLFLDEVRETKRWISVFEKLDWSSTKESLVELEQWVQFGLGRFIQLLQVEDGPLGWASNPGAFAICTRILCGAKALDKKHGSPTLHETIFQIKQLLESSDTQVSRLLLEPLDDV